VFEQTGVRPPSGFLFSGPPGTGKTLTAKALATETGLRLITVDPASLFSKWVGESEKALRLVFKKAKQAAPCILFFDGLEALAPSRRGTEDDSAVQERLSSQLFAELDELAELGEVVVVGATSRPDLVDPALLRPGRFGFTILFTRPDAARREEILGVHLRGVPLDGDVDLAEVARDLDGCSGADIAGACQRALLAEIERFVARHEDDADARARAGAFRLERATLLHAVQATRRRPDDAEMPDL
jgi:transitional endoplasmic reticulum ATPase